MIRQRVDFSGNVRGLEPADQLPACTMPLSETGYIKEGPAMRYIEGQAKWDRKFHRVRKRVARHRKRNLKKAKNKDADRIRKNWVSVGENIKASMPDEPADDEHHHHHGEGEDDRDSSSSSSSSSEEFPDGDDTDLLGSTWGWALNGEAPPPSAIVSRRDLVSFKFSLWLANTTARGPPPRAPWWSGRQPCQPLAPAVPVGRDGDDAGRERERAHVRRG